MSEQTDPPVRYQVDDAVATITLNRPDSMNSLDDATKDILLETVQQAAADPAVRCVVLTGSGRGFCVGQDLKEHAGRLDDDPGELWATVARHYAPTAQALATMPKPVVAAVNGVAAGAGLSLAMACDWRLASDAARFATAFTAIGLSCDTGTSYTLPRLVGTTKAMELLLWPRNVDADEALAIGLVNWVVPAATFEEEVTKLAGRLAAGPTLAYAAIKESVRFSATHTFAEALEFEGTLMERTGRSADHRNAVAAFLEKERPTFEGR